ncbi:MAG: hypothetical protein AUH94_03225 [Ktedonobacter sp. 13_2_20CM_2_54_8]|nr:MAG: hypothetical protein AUH94_03225 [Ktedonobacter sp. 13_2_20CM_2_54_8]
MINMQGSSPGGRFAFLDAGETVRRLGIDRVTLDQWVRDGRIKAYKGVGRDSFYKAADVDALNTIPLSMCSNKCLTAV